jgi:glutathione synthase/RimK-type ligase-like ATP-grasp enzyme
LGIPHVPTYAFYTRKEALLWVKNAKYPKVFKLRGGAGAVNVSLVKNKRKARKLVKKAFSTGFKHINRWTSFKDAILKFKKQNNFKTALGLVKGFGRFIIPTEVEKMSGKQKGYVYFQDFIPENEYDTRLYVIGNRCFGTRRYNRKNDFRASGSNIVKNQKELFDPECIKLAFDISKKLRTQSLACDFLIQDGIYKVVEISYCFPAENTLNHPGYWDRELNWHNVKIIPQHFMIEDLIKSISGI